MKEKPDAKTKAIYRRLKNLKEVLNCQTEKLKDIEERLSILERKVR